MSDDHKSVPSEGDAEVAETPPSTPDLAASSSEPEAAKAEAAQSTADGEESAAGEPRKVVYPALYRAYRTRRPVEGTVLKVIKGGYEVKVGKSRGFCPHSQMDVQRIEDPESFVDQKMEFRITQIRRGGEDLVVSRRALLEAARSDERKAVMATLVEGLVTQGTVCGLAEFGVFVDLGAGVQGLVHVSELAHGRTRRVEDAVELGEAVRVKILKIDSDRGRISLSRRQAEADPWGDVDTRFQVGQTYPGQVVRLADFGAFVALSEGVEALAPASEFPPMPNGWRNELEPGKQADWLVLSIDRKRRRISVTPPGTVAGAAEVNVGAELSGQVQRIENYGVFVWLGPGRVGLMPRALTTQGREPLEKRFRIGDSVDVSVLEITEGGKRIRVAQKGAEIEPERPQRGRRREPERRESPAPDEQAGTFGTSLADKLRAALSGD